MAKDKLRGKRHCHPWTQEEIERREKEVSKREKNMDAWEERVRSDVERQAKKIIDDHNMECDEKHYKLSNEIIGVSSNGMLLAACRNAGNLVEKKCTVKEFTDALADSMVDIITQWYDGRLTPDEIVNELDIYGYDAALCVEPYNKGEAEK